MRIAVFILVIGVLGYAFPAVGAKGRVRLPQRIDGWIATGLQGFPKPARRVIERQMRSYVATVLSGGGGVEAARPSVRKRVSAIAEALGLHLYGATGESSVAAGLKSTTTQRSRQWRRLLAKERPAARSVLHTPALLAQRLVLDGDVHLDSVDVRYIAADSGRARIWDEWSNDRRIRTDLGIRFGAELLVLEVTSGRAFVSGDTPNGYAAHVVEPEPALVEKLRERGPEVVGEIVGLEITRPATPMGVSLFWVKTPPIAVAKLAAVAGVRHRPLTPEDFQPTKGSRGHVVLGEHANGTVSLLSQQETVCAIAGHHVLTIQEAYAPQLRRLPAGTQMTPGQTSDLRRLIANGSVDVH